MLKRLTKNCPIVRTLSGQSLKIVQLSGQKFTAQISIPRREYKTLVKAKKAEFISQLSKDIESGVNINWHRFKKLKTQLGKESSLDTFDMLNFCRFFKNLYSKPPLSHERLAELVINKDEPSSSML